MESILYAILGNDNASRTAAEMQLNEFKEVQPSNVLLQLSAVLTSSLNEAYRSLSAILLRGIVLREPQLWSTLTTEQYYHIRNQLLESLIKEEIGHVQRKIADTVAAHAILSEWNELMQGVVQLSISQNKKHHELCLFLLDKLAEYVGSYLILHIDAISGIIIPFLSDNDIQIQAYAVQALCSLLHEISSDNTSTNPNTSILYHSLQQIPNIVIKIIEKQEDLILYDMLKAVCRLSKERSELFSQSCEQLFSSLQSLCMHDDMDGSTKIIGLEIYIDLLASRKSAIYSTPKNRMECLQLCMRLMTTVDEDDDAISLPTRPESEDNGFGDVDGDGQDGNISDYAAVCLDTLSKSFDAAEIVQVCLTSAWNLVSQVR
jgi:hypothetical protein